MEGDLLIGIILFFAGALAGFIDFIACIDADEYAGGHVFGDE